MKPSIIMSYYAYAEDHLKHYLFTFKTIAVRYHYYLFQ